jgi:hypothetical protein
MAKITVKDTEIVFYEKESEDYISLTDMAKHKNAEATGYVISRWLSARYTIDFMGIWEKVSNPDFNVVEFNNIKNESGTNGYVLTTKQWLERTNAIGIIAKPGRYGSGTFAHKDIAFEFASWISPEFKFYLIKEFQRLKKEEQKALGWTAKRELAKINYRIHTDAIKENLIVPELTQKQISFVYANEADMLNVALFGETAGEWRIKNPDKKGNMRDFASIEQLLVLANLESYNAILIGQGLSQAERIVLLNNTARKQLESLLNARIEHDKLLALHKRV